MIRKSNQMFHVRVEILIFVWVFGFVGLFFCGFLFVFAWFIVFFCVCMFLVLLFYSISEHFSKNSIPFCKHLLNIRILLSSNIKGKRIAGCKPVSSLNYISRSKL